MSYQRKTRPKYLSDAFIMLALTVGMVGGAALVKTDAWLDAYASSQFVSPLAQGTIKIVEVEKTVKDENIDTWIREAASKYQNANFPESYLKYQLHCLANKESGHRYENHTKCGDGGKSCGLYQYRQGTWNGFRKIMIKQGLATEIGSLWDNKLQVETTAWALSDGRHQNWGPWLRGQCH